MFSTVVFSPSTQRKEVGHRQEDTSSSKGYEIRPGLVVTQRVKDFFDQQRELGKEQRPLPKLQLPVNV